VKLLGILTALLGSALIATSGKQLSAAEKWTAPAAEARMKNPVAVTESSLAAGQKIYLKRCVACHGKTGNGDGPPDHGGYQVTAYLHLVAACTFTRTSARARVANAARDFVQSFLTRTANSLSVLR
jgi:cytochrome c